MSDISVYDDMNVRRYWWYEKPALMNQKMFHLPVLGWVTVFQFALLAGAGLPGMYIALSLGGVYAAPWPIAVAFIFAKFRPPLLGYEVRLYHVLNFRLFGPKAKKEGPKAVKYSMPRASGEGSAKEAKPEPDAPLEIPVSDRPRDFHMKIPANRELESRVEVRLDGKLIATPYPNSDHTVFTKLYPDDMVGKRVITIHDMEGKQIAGREFVFVAQSTQFA